MSNVVNIEAMRSDADLKKITKEQIADTIVLARDILSGLVSFDEAFTKEIYRCASLCELAPAATDEQKEELSIYSQKLFLLVHERQ